MDSKNEIFTIISRQNKRCFHIKYGSNFFFELIVRFDQLWILGMKLVIDLHAQYKINSLFSKIQGKRFPLDVKSIF